MSGTSGVSGPFSGLMRYTPPPDRWVSDCWSVPFAATATIKFVLTCVGTISVTMFTYSGLGCTGVIIDSTLLTLAEFTCIPLHLKFTGIGIGTVSEIFIDDPGTPGTDCPCDGTTQVLGCSGVGLGGAGIVLKTSGGATIDTSTTDSSGSYTPPVTGFGYQYIISKTRFTTTTFTNQTLKCDATPTIVPMSGHVATGYQCFTGCASPLSQTLTITFSSAGPLTMTFSGGQWAGTFTVSGNSYSVFLSTTRIFLIQRNGSTCSGVAITFNSCPPSFLATIGIAAGTCATDLGTSATLTE